MVVLYFSDCDPSGWQMPISVARKLQAFKVLHVPRPGLRGPSGRAHPRPGPRVRLAINPVEGHREARPTRGGEAMGCRADRDRRARLAAAGPAAPDRPRRHRAVLRHAPSTGESHAARQQWLDRGQAVSTSNRPRAAGPDARRGRREAAELRERDRRHQRGAADRRRRLRPAGHRDPRPTLNARLYPLPLLDSSWAFAQQCQALIDSKAYRNGGGS